MIILVLSWFVVNALILGVLSVGAEAEREIMEEMDTEIRLRKYRN